MKTAIITGASSGIGAAITKELLHLGYRVFGFGRDFTSLLADLEKEGIYTSPGSDFIPIVLDFMQTGKLIEKIREIRKTSKIFLLINNAGVGYFGLHEELKPSMIHEMVTVNLEVPMLLCQLLLRDLKETGGHIIQISSITAKKNSPHGCAYGATKAGLTAFSQSLFDEARKYGVRITCIHPDMTKSNFYRNADFGTEADPACSLSPEDVTAAVRAVLTAREGMVIPDITLTPQKHRIAKREKRFPNLK
ncbi:MAG: SDR family oxidoreductase [Lachnospiraceae bacterium]|nr:SDR family oxidoreductase [Lachnospiraceae bacterium]